MTTALDFTRIAYPDWMDIAQCLYDREEQWTEAGSPAHGFATMLPGFATCLYCGKPERSVAHNVAAQAAAYAPSPAMLAALIGRGTASLAGIDTLASLSGLWKAGDAGLCTPGDRCVPGGPGVGYKCDAHLPPASLAGVIAGMDHLAEQVHGIRLDADTIVIAGEKYIRRPF